MKVVVVLLSFSLIAICNVLGASTGLHSKKHHGGARNGDSPPCAIMIPCPPCNCSTTPPSDQELPTNPAGRHGHLKKSSHKRSHSVRDGGPTSSDGLVAIGPCPVITPPSCPPCDCESTQDPNSPPQTPGTPPSDQGSDKRHNRHGSHAVKHHASKKHLH